MLRGVAIACAVVVGGCGGPGSSPVLPQPVDLFAPAGQPLPGLSARWRERFEKGREVFTRQLAPAQGLGPEYSASACGACHEKPALGGGASRYRQVFVRTHVVDDFRVPFQPQFSNASSLALTPRGTTTGVRSPIPFFGAGLLAEIPNEELVSHADPNDLDGDGISGRVNFERGFIGRFGRKAQMATLQGFVRLALKDHLGITTLGVDASELPGVEGPFEVQQLDRDDVPDPELAEGDLSDLLAFVALLAPLRPDAPTELSEGGRAQFHALGCAACHLPELHGPHGAVPAYTDLLLHDMGPELADGIRVGAAEGDEFRTQPLWGIAAVGPYLHDGRADTLDAAIRAHGGEAARAREAYASLEESQREAVLVFLRSLGGGEARPDGLLPMQSAVPAAGTLGGPASVLEGDEVARFERGRVLFDRDFALSGGLGPSFNGDSCRSCHFSGAMGGGGPRDVDVMRVGTLHDDGTFTEPAAGTMAHRHGIDGTRPALPEGLNVFERRQTPPLFGLGLIAAIADETIAARADPDDRDGDGVRGRLARLSDGRIGRFGWKAGNATLAEFVAGAAGGELGLTLPGGQGDADGVADPELSAPELEALQFFVAKLAPPAPAPGRSRGAVQFAELGCSACHVPSLPTREGAPVPLYSDLLLHDVAPSDAKRVVDPIAGRAFRTPPLWGLSLSAPYLHDGSAATIEEAIARHDGEALSSVSRWRQASEDARAELAAFLRSL